MHGAITVQAERRRVYSYAEAKPVIAGTKVNKKIRTAKRFGEKITAFGLSPVVILYEAVEGDWIVPSGLAEKTADFLLNGWRDKPLAIAELVEVGAAMLADEMITDV